MRGVGLHGAGQQLIEIALALVVQSAPAHIADFDRGAPDDLALESGIPFPCHGDLEHRVLNRLGEGKRALRGAGREIHQSVHYGLLQLERRIAAQRGVAIDGGAIGKRAESGAQGRCRREGVRQAKARLEDLPLRGRKAIRKAVVEAGIQAGVQGGNASAFGAGHAVARQHDAVIRIAADDEAAFGIDHRGSGRVVVLRQELRNVAPLAVPGGPQRPAQAIREGQLVRDLPAILREQVERVRHVGRVGFGAEFGISIEIAEDGVGDGEARGVGIAGVVET